MFAMLFVYNRTKSSSTSVAVSGALYVVRTVSIGNMGGLMAIAWHQNSSRASLESMKKASARHGSRSETGIART